MFLFSCLLMILLTLLVLAFFFFFGCAYEFITYYLQYKKEEKIKKKLQMNRPIDQSDSNEYINTYNNRRRIGNNNDNNDRYNVNNNINHNNNNFNYNIQDDSNEEKEEKCDNETICICVILGILGFGLQPVYLMFYLLIAMMECYRRFACWYFYF